MGCLVLTQHNEFGFHRSLDTHETGHPLLACTENSHFAVTSRMGGLTIVGWDANFALGRCDTDVGLRSHVSGHFWWL